MCVEVFTGSGPEIGTPENLPSKRGGTMADAMKDAPDDGSNWRDCCLCPVDVVSAVMRRQFWIQREETGGYDVRRPDELSQ